MFLDTIFHLEAAKSDNMLSISTCSPKKCCNVMRCRAFALRMIMTVTKYVRKSAATWGVAALLNYYDCNIIRPKKRGNALRCSAFSDEMYVNANNFQWKSCRWSSNTHFCKRFWRPYGTWNMQNLTKCLALQHISSEKARQREALQRFFV